MSSFLIRNTAILARIETTYGVDATPTGAADALLVSDLSVEPEIDTVSRDLLRPYLGGSEQLAGVRRVKAVFTVELAGSGTAGAAPAWGALLRACGFAETIIPGARVEYLPISAAFPSLTLYWYGGGVIHRIFGARGTAELDMSAGARPTMKFSFTGIDGGISTSALPSVTLTAWRTPVTITDPNAGDINLGCTYSAGALSGGVTYPSLGLTLNLGNEVRHVPRLGGESVEITERQVSGHIDLDLTAAQRAAFYNDAVANTLTGLGFQYGVAVGHRILIHAPAAQRTAPKILDRDGFLMSSYDLRLLPVAGNDELRIVAL